MNASDFYCEDLQKRENFDEIQDKNLQMKLNGWYGTLRLSPLDGKLNTNYIPIGKNGSIGASEILHNRSNLLIKKPKNFMLFGNKPTSTSLMDREEIKKKIYDSFPETGYKKKHLALILSRATKQISNMNDLFIKGTNKFESEVEYGLKVPENSRILVTNTEEMKDEKKYLSVHPEEILESHFESRTLY